VAVLLQPLVRRMGSAGAAWRAVLLSWLAARAVVLLGLLIASALPADHRDGLLGWDADWYRRIADLGYGHLPDESVRFFPLLPLLARALALGTDPGWALLLIANGCALGVGFLTHRLALREGLGECAAKRVVWVVALAPAGYVLVMGYTEPLYLVLLAGLLLGLRERRWLLVAVLGAAAGGLRPTGVLVVLPVLVEALRGLRGAGVGELSRRAAAVLAPAVGLAAYLGWVGATYGSPFLPYTVQQREKLRGGTFVDPLPGIVHAFQAPFGSPASGALLHLPGIAVAVVLVVVVARRLPLSHTAYTALTLLLALTGREVQSFDRYALSALPLVLAAGIVLTTRRAAVVALGLSTGMLLLSSVLAFHHSTVP
jgi:hypothetical protein